MHFSAEGSHQFMAICMPLPYTTYTSTVWRGVEANLIVYYVNWE